MPLFDLNIHVCSCIIVYKFVCYKMLKIMLGLYLYILLRNNNNILVSFTWQVISMITVYIETSLLWITKNSTMYKKYQQKDTYTTNTTKQTTLTDEYM